MTPTKIKLSLTPDKVKPLSAMDGFTGDEMERLGITMNVGSSKAAMDAAPTSQLGAAVGNPVQFFQYWMPKAIEVITAARNADRLLGRTVIGDWADEEIVIKMLERVGQVGLYSDSDGIPLASYTYSFEKRGNVRFELGMQSGLLADIRAARMQFAPDGEKRAAIATAFAQNQNKVAFYGFNLEGATAGVYGLFNDPNLLPVLTETDSAGNAYKTLAASDFATQIARINGWMTTLITQTGQNFNPQTDKFRVGISPKAYNAMLTTLNPLGTMSVLDWFTTTYKGATIINAIEFEGADAGADMAVVILDSLGNSPVVMQAVTSEMRLLGVEPRITSTTEAYSSSTAGTIVLQPLGILRVTGV